MQKNIINPEIEKRLQQTIFPDLLRGRKDFDLPHTKAVVYWAKFYLKKHLNLNPKILITSAYAHDWGYIGLFEKVSSNNIKEINKRKPLHMLKGSKKIQNLLERNLSSFFNNNEIKRVSHLVLIHDEVEKLKDEDEIFLMECDTLGMLDIDKVKPTFSKKDNDFFIKEQVFGRRLPKFIHQEMLTKAKALATKRSNFFI